MEAVVVSDTETRRVEIVLALDDVVVTRSRYAAGERGPDPHVHLLHADCFYVLEGAFTLELADGQHALGPGTFALVPPHVVHAFRNDGPGDCRFLNLHAPGMGFDRYVQAIHGTGEEFRADLAARYDQHPPPAGGGGDPGSAIVRTPESVESVTIVGNRIAFLANAEETLGAAGIVEYAAAPSFGGPPPHIHDGTFDAYLVLDGRLAVQRGDERLELGPGDVAVVPPGTVHGFANVLDETTRFVDIHAPGGLERYFRDVSAALAGGPPDPAVMGEIASRYDFRPA